MHTQIKQLLLAFSLGLVLILGSFLMLDPDHWSGVVLAQGPTIRYVASTGNDNNNDCTNSNTPCMTVQHAVDVADAGDEIRIAAGSYTDVQTRPRKDLITTGVVTQVVYISKTIAIRGGYTTTNWAMFNPLANPTTLDAQMQGRVLYITGDISPTIEGLTMIGGEAAGLGGSMVGLSTIDAGGQVYIISATATLSNNLVLGRFDVFTYSAQSGGGLFIHNSDGVRLSYNTINGNGAGPGGAGGGVHFSSTPNAILVANTIAENHTNIHSSGGGLFFNRSPAATLTGNTILDNGAVGGGVNQGGGLFCNLSDNLTLVENVIGGNNSDSNGGGLLFQACNNTIISTNTITDNVACCGGGVRIVNSNNVTLTNNQFSDNYAAGLGVTAGGGALQVWHSTELALMNNLFSHNGANRAGGGASFVNSSNVTLTDNTIIDHTQGNFIIYGAGLYFENMTNTLLASNIITNNGPVNFGGGLYLDNSDLTLINNVIAANQAEPGGQGSGLYLQGSTAHLLHNTISGNTGGDGSGVSVSLTSTAAMTNTILVSQTIGLTVTANNTATLNGVLWDSNGLNTGGNGLVIVTNEFTGDPAFAVDGYHLTKASAAIDKGKETTVTNDIDDDPRPLDGNLDGIAMTDLGADEFGFRISLPIIFRNSEP